MIRRIADSMRRVFQRRAEANQPVVRRNAHRACDTCGQVSGTLIDGMCEWCHKLFGAHK